MILLNEFRPVSRLEVPNEEKTVPKFPVIDVHNHLGKTLWITDNPANQSTLKEDDPAAVYESTNKYHIRHMVSLDGLPGERLDEHIKAYVNKYLGRFSVFARIDYARLEEPGFEKYFDNHIKSLSLNNLCFTESDKGAR